MLEKEIPSIGSSRVWDEEFTTKHALVDISRQIMATMVWCLIASPLAVVAQVPLYWMGFDKVVQRSMV
jgi:hypothetical protein